MECTQTPWVVLFPSDFYGSWSLKTMVMDSCFWVRHSSQVLPNVDTMHPTESKPLFHWGNGDGEYWVTAANTCWYVLGTNYTGDCKIPSMSLICRLQKYYFLEILNDVPTSWSEDFTCTQKLISGFPRKSGRSSSTEPSFCLATIDCYWRADATFRRGLGAPPTTGSPLPLVSPNLRLCQSLQKNGSEHVSWWR